MASESDCSLTKTTLGKTIGALILENEFISLTVLPDKGADMYRLIYKPKNIDVLAKSPTGLKDPRYTITTASSPENIWLEHYEGGWQLLFPNGGDPCVYKNSELTFHGEASLSSWDYEIEENGPGAVRIKLFTRLFRTPFLLERTVTLHRGEKKFSLREKIVNYGKEPCDYMWGHHPAFGPPFLSPDCIVQTDAGSLLVDDTYAGINNPLELNSEHGWPNASVEDGRTVDLSRIPGPEEERAFLYYLKDFKEGWYAITNSVLEMGVALTWPAELFPFAWYWQDINCTPGFPWYKNYYVTAIEPNSSIPGQGLARVIEKTGLQGTLGPGEEREAVIICSLFESRRGVQNVDNNGNVVIQ